MRLPIAREGWAFILPLLIAAFVAAIWSVWLSLAFLVAATFVAFFFRDPERAVPPGDHTLVSPADGKVLSVRKVREDRYLHSEATLITIFLNITDVHVNRTPAAGTVEYLEYVPGKKVVAFADKASEINERNYIGFACGPGKVLVCQIAGLIARRIVCWLRPGDAVAKGGRFGLIKFGSCTQVWLPPGVTATVQAGDRVIGGWTVIGRVSHEV